VKVRWGEEEKAMSWQSQYVTLALFGNGISIALASGRKELEKGSTGRDSNSEPQGTSPFQSLALLEMEVSKFGGASARLVSSPTVPDKPGTRTNKDFSSNIGGLR
jgi:hypothetical protein